jgi:hypothetical protein
MRVGCSDLTLNPADCSGAGDERRASADLSSSEQQVKDFSLQNCIQCRRAVERKYVLKSVGSTVDVQILSYR